MIYILLFLSFMKIGLFSFGGGYAMIPLIMKEIEIHGWISSSEFMDIIAISEMTPGPIAINTATFVGYKTAGFFGSMVATIGVTLPSLVLILIISNFFFKFQNSSIKKNLFYGIRPAVTGLIVSACIYIAQTTLLKRDISELVFNDIINEPNKFFDVGGVIIFILSIIALVKFKLNPIIVILGAGVSGIIISSISF